MKVLGVRAQTCSPVVVTRVLEGEGRFYRTNFYLPGSQIFGALVNSLILENLIEANALLDLVKSMRVSTGFPYHVNCHANNPWWERIYAPPSCLQFVCKICGSRKILDWRKVGTSELYAELMSSCSCGGREFEPLNRWTCLSCNKIQEFSLESRTNVGINPETGCSYPEDRGLLFTYDAIPAGREFVFTICADDKYMEALKKMEGRVIYIGRRISVGLGQLKLIQTEEIDLKKEAEKIVKSSEIIGVMFLTPACELSLSDRGVVSQCRIDWAKNLKESFRLIFGEEMNLSVQEMGFWGRTEYVQCGYSWFYDTRRPTIRAISPGSVVKLRTDGVESLKALAGLRFLGAGLYKNFGFGQVIIVGKE